MNGTTGKCGNSIFDKPGFIQGIGMNEEEIRKYPLAGSIFEVNGQKNKYLLIF